MTSTPTETTLVSDSRGLFFEDDELLFEGESDEMEQRDNSVEER